jgi:hypothetical protein
MGLRDSLMALLKKTKKVKTEAVKKTQKAKTAKKKVSTAETKLKACKEEVTLAKQRAKAADDAAKEALKSADATITAMSKATQREISETKKTAKSLASLKIKRPTRKVVVETAPPQVPAAPAQPPL